LKSEIDQNQFNCNLLKQMIFLIYDLYQFKKGISSL